MTEEEISNPPIVFNFIPGAFGGHTALKEVGLEVTPNRKSWVRCKPFARQNNKPGFLNIIKGKGSSDEANHVYKELIEAGCRIEVPGSGDDIRGVVMYLPEESLHFPDWFMKLEQGTVLDMVQTMKQSAITIKELQKRRQWTDNETKDYLASSSMDGYLMNKILEPVKKMIGVMTEKKELDKKSKDSGGT